MAEFVKGLSSLRRKLAKLGNPTDRRTADQVGKTIVKETKNRIAKGTSPVAGEKNYPAYSSSYKDQIRRGRGAFRNKRIRPINLKLTGKMLNALKHRVKKTQTLGFATIVGFFSAKQSDKVQFNRDNGRNPWPQPSEGETFKAGINKKIKDIYLKKIRSITRSKA